jgi:hypothetical protein
MDTIAPVNAPTAPPNAHLPVLRRLGILLLVFAGIHVASLGIDLLTESRHSYSIDILSLIVGVLLLNGSLGAARFLCWLTAFEIVASLGGLLLVATIVPFALTPELRTLVLQQLGVGGIFWMIASNVVETAISFWILRELRRPEITAALSYAGKRPMRGMILGGSITGGVLVALLAVVFAVAAPFVRQTLAGFGN